jgi:hypothetical protein
MKLRPWYVVFGINDLCPEPVALLSSLRPPVPEISMDFRDHMPWSRGEFKFPAAKVRGFRLPAASKILVSRHSGDLRETLAPHIEFVRQNPDWGTAADGESILTHLHSARQIISVMPIAVGREARMARICEQICGQLCRLTDGFIAVHQEGFFSPQGESLFPRCANHRLMTE